MDYVYEAFSTESLEATVAGTVADTEEYLLILSSWFVVSGLWSFCLVLVNVKPSRNLTVLTWDVWGEWVAWLLLLFPESLQAWKISPAQKTRPAAVHLQHPDQSPYGSVFVSMNWKHALWPGGERFFENSNSLFWKKQQRLVQILTMKS